MKRIAFAAKTPIWNTTGAAKSYVAGHTSASLLLPSRGGSSGESASCATQRRSVLRREGEETLDDFNEKQFKMYAAQEHGQEGGVGHGERKARQKELRAAAKALGGKTNWTINPAKLETLKSLRPADLHLRQHQHRRHMANLKHKKRKRRSRGQAATAALLE
ncbi:hypothetical protein V8E36_008483 [Tilletia maclaganii]